MWVESIKNLPEDAGNWELTCEKFRPLSFAIVVQCHPLSLCIVIVIMHRLLGLIHINCQRPSTARGEMTRGTHHLRTPKKHVGLNDTNVLMSELLPFVSCVVKFHDMNEWHNTNVPLHPLLLMLMPTAISTFCHSHPLEYIGLNDAKMLLSKFLSDICSIRGMTMDMTYASEVYDMRCDVCSGGIGSGIQCFFLFEDQLCNAYYYNLYIIYPFYLT
ncbi:uncharacterized protein LACBIDRAFT_321910 [Laccaria bicolor S238N-H82]|uniref:Predicted protein n=1 Tax=Laccaria bicolor (strain S238N-H82 / ATCC MYA-4686) TaxID=486041 RepID=B0CUL1_LACBS|nr:uncharacterized protein LACBIDRAFT_321910 [Laccaria bicolor S238N-H82]EDR14690.1 predicted protein [Laccaria bicolor S238N-H82]|eukprot:XP_001875249.1 predicted protein [Laccaria bicolor S238N-H82]